MQINAVENTSDAVGGQGSDPEFRPAKRQRMVAAAPSSSSQAATDFEGPCDICRKRKLRCAGEPGSDKCFLCAFHQRPCTFIERPQSRRRAQRRRQPRRIPDTATHPHDGEGSRPAGLPAAQDQNGQVSHGSGALLTADCTAGDDAPAASATHASHASPATAPASPPVTTATPSSPTSPASLLNRTLGLHKTTNSVYIGSSSLQEPSLLTCHEGTSPSTEPQHIRYRRMDDSTVFVQRPDQSPDGQLDVLDTIEALVRPHGPALVSLYFRIVHPSYPILHKGVWFEKYQRSYREFSPPLLAAVYALAIDWWEYDLALASRQKPPVDQLVAIATQTLTWAMTRPKLSAVQAGLLLLQRSGGDSWVLTSQMVALSEDLGLHVDCSPWDIPDWEKGVRRRLTWAVFMQDKWGALIHGRPSHVSAHHWRAAPLQLSDFPESAADEDDAEVSAEVEKGRHLFMRLAQLTEIMSEALAILYTPCPATYQRDERPDVVVGLLEQIKPIALRLKHWASTLPPDLGMDNVKARKLCSNGYLHLSYYATEIMIHRHIIRGLTPGHPDHIQTICRDAAQTRLDHAMAFVEKLRPEHLQSFWWFAAPKSLALIGIFAALLSATSASSAETAFFKQKLDDFHWSLKVRSKGSLSITAAVEEMQDALLGLSTSQPPHAPSRPPTSTVRTSLPTCSAPGGGQEP